MHCEKFMQCYNNVKFFCKKCSSYKNKKKCNEIFCEQKFFAKNQYIKNNSFIAKIQQIIKFCSIS